MPGNESIRELEEQPSTTEPDVDDSSESGGVALPSPSISRRTLILVGIAVTLAVAIWWYRNNVETVDRATAELTAAAEESVDDDDDATAGEIEVPQDRDAPLKGDEAVIEALKDGGHISGSGDE